MKLSLIAQALTSLANVKLYLNLYTSTTITSVETLTADATAKIFSFAHSDIISNSYGVFSEGGSAISTAFFTFNYELGNITFTAAKTGAITCAGYSYLAWDYSKDRILERFVNSTSDMVSKYCNRKFIADTYTEYYRGLGSTRIVLNQYPINKITSVKVNSAAYTAGIDYVTADRTYLDRGFLVRESGWTWYGYETGLVRELTAPVDNVEVVYSAGYTLSNLPSDIEDVVIDMVSILYSNQANGANGLKSLSQGQLKYDWKQDPLTMQFAGVLDTYKKVVV
jgi:hypothetical protein